MGRTMTIETAAAVLGISKEAVRKRIQRGTLEAVKDATGRWQITLDDTGRTDGQDTGQDDPGRVQANSDAVQAMRDEIIFLRKELERRDQLMAMLMQRVPQLEAPKQTGFFTRLFKRSHQGEK